VLQRLVERLERRIDRLADCRPDQRMEDVDEGTGIPPDRTAQRRRQHLAEPLIACRGLGNCSRENATDGDRQLLGIVQHLTEVPRQFDLAPEQQGTQLFEPGIEGRDAIRLCADVGIDVPGQLDQQPGKHLPIDGGIACGGKNQRLERGGGRAHPRGSNLARAIVTRTPATRS
jgi:hypothetical protein